MHPSSPAPAYLGQERAGAPHVPDDVELVCSMARGDEQALGMLYDRWQPLLFSVAVQVLGDADDAEEVLEETFWQAWRQAGRYEPARGAVSTWLTMMVRSRALDRARARRRLREEGWEELPEPADDGELLPVAGSPLAAAEQAELRTLVARALRQLPAEQRETVELAYFRGLSQSEIAEATGQPLGTVKTRARLALQKLREALSMLREESE